MLELGQERPEMGSKSQDERTQGVGAWARGTVNKGKGLQDQVDKQVGVNQSKCGHTVVTVCYCGQLSLPAHCSLKSSGTCC